MIALVKKLLGLERAEAGTDLAKPPKWMTETKASPEGTQGLAAREAATEPHPKLENPTGPSLQPKSVDAEFPEQQYSDSAESRIYELSEEQARLFDTIEESSEHWFITGRAGSGKSFLLRYLADNTSKPHIVVAPTGVAAINAEGVTIHSAFSLPPRFIDRHEVIQDHRMSEEKRLVLENIDLLIIDEISMVRADLMDGVDLVLRKVRRSDTPFGGVQVVMFGDLFQLPPIVDDKALVDYFAHNHGGSHFFNAFVWRTAKLQVHELQTSYRQRDEDFLEILDCIRNGEVTKEQIRQLNSRLIDGQWRAGTKTVYLTGTKARADVINAEKLRALPGELEVYVAKLTGESLGKSLPTDVRLVLKPGAQVMMVKNKPSAWVNGDMGTVTDLSDYHITVEIDGIEHDVGTAIWEKYRYSYDPFAHRVTPTIVGTFEQYPVKLAWAITIHKAQGQTFDDIVVDLGSGAFDSGQAYVALSRIRPLDGLKLAKPLRPADLIVDHRALEFMDLQRVPF